MGVSRCWVVDYDAVVGGSQTRCPSLVEVAWLGCAAAAVSWADRRGLRGARRPGGHGDDVGKAGGIGAQGGRADPRGQDQPVCCRWGPPSGHPLQQGDAVLGLGPSHGQRSVDRPLPTVRGGPAPNSRARARGAVTAARGASVYSVVAQAGHSPGPRGATSLKRRRRFLKGSPRALAQPWGWWPAPRPALPTQNRSPAARPCHEDASALSMIVCRRRLRCRAVVGMPVRAGDAGLYVPSANGPSSGCDRRNVAA